MDIEGLLSFLESRVGRALTASEWRVRFPVLARAYLDQVEDYYERGGGTLPAKFRGFYHNLAVWGLTVRESLDLTPALCQRAIDEGEGFIDDDFIGVPSGAMYRTAQRVLCAHGRGYSQVQALEELSAAERPDVILLWLGSNDCLGTVLTLEVRDMQAFSGAVPNDPLERLAWNLTSAEVFTQDYDELARRVAHAAPHAKVFVGTIPEVTIPPITHGIGARTGRYYEYYARFFVDNTNFNQRLDHLTGKQARLIDERIGSFNQTIRAAAERHGFHLVDTCELLRQLAVKRNNFESDPSQALVRYYTKQPDHPLLQLELIPSALNLECDELGRPKRGGLFSLDGVHPSTIGYGIIAEAFLAVMQKAGVEGANPARLSWKEIIGHDALSNHCPALWSDVVKIAQDHPTFWNLLFRALA
jgi:lysophospholipase L1-like esterase